MSQAEPSFWDAVDAIRERDASHRREAYGFLMAALGWTVGRLSEERRADPVQRHLSGAELLAGMLALAREEVGSFAPVVFKEWGLVSGEDVGQMRSEEHTAELQS